MPTESLTVLWNCSDYTSLRLQGRLRDLAESITRQWLVRLPESNPMLLGMFHYRDAPQPRPLLPWSGEFAGKYLTSAAEVFALTGAGRIFSTEHLSGFSARHMMEESRGTKTLQRNSV
jgi:hypothetical protein